MAVVVSEKMEKGRSKKNIRGEKIFFLGKEER
jgi:hypothetical protein